MEDLNSPEAKIKKAKEDLKELSNNISSFGEDIKKIKKKYQNR